MGTVCVIFMYMYKYVCVYVRSLTPHHILSYLPQPSRLISTTGNWARYDGVYLCNVHKPVVPCAHPQCNVRFVLSSFNPRTMPSPFPCIIELKPVETVKSPRAKFKCKGPRRNDKPKRTEKKTNECNKRNWGQGLTRRCREEVEWAGSGVTCAGMSFLILPGIPLSI